MFKKIRCILNKLFEKKLSSLTLMELFSNLERFTAGIILDILHNTKPPIDMNKIAYGFGIAISIEGIGGHGELLYDKNNELSLIIINEDVEIRKQRYLIAYFIGRILIGRFVKKKYIHLRYDYSDIPSDGYSNEHIYATVFATSILVPLNELRNYIVKNDASMSNIFDVDGNCISIRLYSNYSVNHVLKKIDYSLREHLFDDMDIKYASMRHKVEFYNKNEWI